MVGALVVGQDGYSGLMYKNSTALAEDNSLTLNGPIDSSESVQKDCDPPRYEELKGPCSGKYYLDE